MPAPLQTPAELCLAYKKSPVPKTPATLTPAQQAILSSATRPAPARIRDLGECALSCTLIHLKV